MSLVVAGSLAAQNVVPRPANRIAQGADLTPKTRMKGNLPRWVVPAADTGAVPDATPLHVTLMLSRGAEQEAAFTQLLVDQQNPSSPRYHQWLTPAQAGEQFGPSVDDVAAVTGWLTQQGLQVSVAPSRIFVEVSGTTGTVGAALGTSFHQFLLEGEPRVSATSEPSIPLALAAVVSGFNGLAELPLRPFHTAKAAQSRTAGDGVHPMFSGPSNTLHYVFPGDFAKIYDIPTLSGGVYAGTGVKVAIIGRSRVAASDITLLEGLAGLPAKTPNEIVPPGSSDPGLVQSSPFDQDESTLDVGRVLTTAPGAQADLVIAATMLSGGGITAAMQYNVQTLVDPIMTISYGVCEASAGTANVNYFDSLFQQAAAEGISTFVSSGDSSAAGCAAKQSPPTGKEVLGINALCSSSYVTCVGGTQFNDTANPALYWSTTNSSTYTSALGYIAEGAWNEPSGQNSSGVTVPQINGTGGGRSLVIAKPTWQTGTGVPSDGARDTPDISFTSAAHDPYYACLAYKGSSYDCATGGGTLFSGTSAAAPSMAAITAILVQKTGKSQGNLNPVLYGMAATTPAAFHDPTPATSGVSSCTLTTASLCNNSAPSSTGATGGLAGYPLQVGYDEATGLGSLDVTNFVNAAVGTTLLATTTNLTAQPSTIVVGRTAVFTATVTGSGAISGTVQFFSNGTALGSPVTLAGGTASTPATTFSTAGTYAITATYSGNTVSATSSGSLSFVVTAVPPIGLTVSATPTTLTVAAGATTGNTSAVTVNTTGAYSGSVILSCAVSYSGGTATYPPTCSFAPTSLTFTGGTSGASVLTVATTLPRAIQAPGASARNGFGPVGGISLAALLLVLIPAKRRKRLGVLVVLPLALAGMISMTGCGTGVSTVVAATPVGTSKGNYTVTVTATPSAGTAATTLVTLIVQ